MKLIDIPNTETYIILQIIKQRLIYYKIPWKYKEHQYTKDN